MRFTCILNRECGGNFLFECVCQTRKQKEDRPRIPDISPKCGIDYQRHVCYPVWLKVFRDLLAKRNGAWSVLISDPDRKTIDIYNRYFLSGYFYMAWAWLRL